MKDRRETLARVRAFVMRKKNKKEHHDVLIDSDVSSCCCIFSIFEIQGLTGYIG